MEIQSATIKGTKKLTFNKESNGRWYIVLPNWMGPHASLEMVAGADSFLDILSNQTHDVSITVGSKSFEGCSELKRLRKCPFNGADYLLHKHNGVKVDHEMWLCNVTLFVLGGFPNTIYFSKAA